MEAKEMTQDEIEKIRAGNEMDALIEVYVFGDDGTNATNKHYSTDIAAAWLVVERMKKLHLNLHLVEYGYDRSYATFDENASHYVEANGENCTALAICRAALLMVMK
jgi:hypothetical protein